jgi:hypothetical protein
MREYWNNLSQQLKPRIHETSAYLIAVTCCVLFITHDKLRQALLIIFGGFGTMSPFFIALGVGIGLGVFFSLVNAFIKREKSSFEKLIMGWFIMGASGVASFAVGLETLPSRSSLMMILPIWNMLIGLLMLCQMGFQKYIVEDEDASFDEVVGSTSALFIILGITEQVLHLSWALTLSICIFYATTIITIVHWAVNYFDTQP